MRQKLTLKPLGLEKPRSDRRIGLAFVFIKSKICDQPNTL